MAIAFRSSFNRAHPETAEAAKNASSKFAADISAETAQAIRNIVTTAVSTGIPPKDAAKLIRNVIGLNGKQAMSVTKLYTSALAAGKPESAAASAAAKQAARYLRTRSETIARTEIMRAENAGQRAAWDEAAANGTIGPRSEKTWIVANDDRLCPYCADLDGTTVPLTGVFTSSIGTVSEPPLHPNCRCTTGLVPARVRVPQGRPGAGAAPTGDVATPGGRKLAETQRAAERALRAEVEAAHAEANALVAVEQAKAAAELAEKQAIEAAQKAAMEAAQKAAAEAAKKAAAEALHKQMVEKEAALAAAQQKALAEQVAAKKAADVAKMEAIRSSGTAKWMDDLLTRRIGPQAGSNPGGMFEDALGRKFYVKEYRDPKQALSEQVTNRIYSQMGVGARVRSQSFAVQASNGKMYYASEIVENSGTVGKLGLTKANADQILKGFSVDVLTVNWDAVGTGLDNVVMAGKRAVRIDMGGTLAFRAQGGAKPLSIFNDISEWDTFYSKNAYYRQVFEKAGLSGADALGKTAIKQIDDIEKFRTEVGGWKKFVTQSLGKSAKGNATFIDETARLLEQRTNLLLQKRAQLQSILSAPVPTHHYSAGSWPIPDTTVRYVGRNMQSTLTRLANESPWTHGSEAKQAIRSYTGSSFKSTNDSLRMNPSQMLSGYDAAMQKALMASKPPKDLQLVWRGARGNTFRTESMGWKQGDIIQMNGFQSTSINPWFAHNWGSSGTLLEIKPTRGMFVDHFSMNSGEQEFILPHAQRYRVVGRKTIRLRNDYGEETTREVIQLEML